MGFPTTEKNAVADAQVARGGYYSLHSGDPGTTGANECAGGSPAYARKLSTLPAASSGSSVGSEVEFDLLGVATYWGRWSAVSAGTFRYGGILPGSGVGIAATQTKVKLTPTIGPVS